MTVPGKGGRPRKWRSDADRVRAFRARQAGEAEPPTLDQALDDGDEIARLWEANRALAEQVANAEAATKRERSARSSAVQKLAHERRQWSWVADRNAELAEECNALKREVVALRTSLDAAVTDRQKSPSFAHHASPQEPGSELPRNRSQRRQAERERRRRKH